MSQQGEIMLASSRLASAIVIGLLGTASISALAAEPRYNQISLRAEVTQQVNRDRMQVTLYSEAQDADPAKLAARVTQTMNDALATARKGKDINVSLGGRSSYPIYEEKGQSISGWRERAEIQLESADFAALSKLTGELLENLSMGNMSFSVSDSTRKRSEDELIKQAVDAFKARAQIATDALGGKTYKIVSLNLNSSGYQPPVRMQALAKSARMDAVTPDVEAGTSDISVNADGVIEVDAP
jgi:predicted secreted protein